MYPIAQAFATETIRLYNLGTALLVGNAVCWYPSAVATEYPEPDYQGQVGPTLTNQTARNATSTIAVPTVKRSDACADVNSLCAVALEDIGATSWGLFALSGVMDVRIGISSNIAVGDALIVSAGCFIEIAASAAAALTAGVPGLALEAVATSAVCSAALCRAFIPRSLGGLDETYGMGTA